MPFVRTDEIKPGVNKIIIRNPTENNVKLFLKISSVYNNYFKYVPDTEDVYPNLLLTSKTIQACLAKPTFRCDMATHEGALIIDSNQPFDITIEDVVYSFDNVAHFLSVINTPGGNNILNNENVSCTILTHLSDIPIADFTYFSSKPYPLLFEESLETQFYPEDPERTWLVTQPKVIEDVETNFTVLDAYLKDGFAELHPIPDFIKTEFIILDADKSPDLITKPLLSYFTDPETGKSQDNSEKINTIFLVNDAMIWNNLIIAFDNYESNLLKTEFNVLDPSIYTIDRVFDDYQTNNIETNFNVLDPEIEGKFINIGCVGATNSTNEIIINIEDDTSENIIDVYLNNSQTKLNTNSLTIQELKTLLLFHNIEIEIIEDP